MKLSLTRPWGAGALAEPSNIRTVYFLLFITVSLLYFYWQITSFARQSLQILLLLISWMIWMYVPVYQNIWRENIKQSLFRGRTVSLRFGNESNHRDLPSQSSEVLSMSLSENKKTTYACTRVRVYHFVPACILSHSLLWVGDMCAKNSTSDRVPKRGDTRHKQNLKLFPWIIHYKHISHTCNQFIVTFCLGCYI